MNRAERRALAKRQKRFEKKVLKSVRSATTSPVDPSSVEVQRDLTTRTYQIRAGSYDEKTRSVEAVIASEQRAIVMDWQRYEPVEEILLMSGASTPDQVPYLNSHDRSSIQSQIGSTREIRVEGETLVARNYFATTPAGKEAESLVREGHLTDNSIGYRVTSYVTIEPGETAEVEGRSFTAGPSRPLRVSTEWTVLENSAVAIGADSTAKNREAAETAIVNRPHTRKEMDMKFAEYVRSLGLDPESLTDDQKTGLRAKHAEQAAPPAELTPEPTPEPKRTAPSTDEAQRQAELEQIRKAESVRQDAIREICGGAHPEIERSAIESGANPDEVARKVLAAERTRQGLESGVSASHVTVGEREGARRQAVECAVAQRAGIELSPEEQTAAREIGHVSLLDVCREGLIISGVPSAEVMRMGRDEIINRSWTTISMATMLTGIANKALLKELSYREPIAYTWCNTSPVSDFKSNTRGDIITGGLVELEANGEIQTSEISDTAESYSITTYAKRFIIDRRTIINDDAGVFNRLPRQLGAAANQKVDDITAAHLTANGNMADGNALFNTTDNTLIESNALNVEGLAAARAAMRTIKSGGKYVNIMPRYLIVPAALEETAMALMAASSIMPAGGSTKTRTPTVNTFQGMYEVVVDPRLDDDSTTSWYLAPDKGVDSFEIGLLDGRREPTLEREELGGAFLGMSWRIYWDGGVKALRRTIIKCTA